LNPPIKNEDLEIIDVTMNISIADEIKKKVDSLSTELTEHTKKVIEKRMKIQKVNRKKLQQTENDGKAQKILKFLEKAHAEDELWVEGKHLCIVAGVNNTPQNLNKLSLQLRHLLEKEDKWTLAKKRKLRKTLYRLTKFS
jgi:chemotaxis response regulator CheB